MIIDFATDDLRRAIKELSGSTGGDASELAPVSALPTSAEAGTVVALYKEEVPLPEYIRFEERDDLGDNNDKTGGRFYLPFRCVEGYTSGNPLYIGSVSTDDEHSYDITLYALDDPDYIYVKVSGFIAVVNGYGSDGYSFSRDGLTFYSHEPENFGDDGMLDFYPTTTGSVSFVLNESAEQLGVYQYDGTTWNEIGSNSGSGGTDKLSALSAFPTSAETGDVVAKVSEIGTWGWDVPYGENLEFASYTFPADFDITQYSQSNQYFVGKFVNLARDGDEMYGEYNVYVFNDSEAGPIVRLNDEAGAGSVNIPTMGEGEGDYGSIDVTYDATNPAELSFGVSADLDLETPWAPEFQLVEGASLQTIYGSDGIYQYDGTDWNKLGTGGSGGVLVVNSLSSSEAAQAPVGTLIGQYREEETYLKTMPTDGDANAPHIVIVGDIDFSSARVQLYLSNGNYYIELGRSGGKWTKMNRGNVNGNWTLDGVNIGGSWTGETDGDVLQIKDGDNWSISFTKQDNGNWIGEIAGGNNPHYRFISNLNGSNAFMYEAIAPIETNLYMKVSGGTVANWRGYQNAGQTDSFEIIYDDLYDFTSFCDGKIMFSIRYQYGSSTRYAFMDAANQAIVLYSDSGKTTEVIRLRYLDNPVRFDAPDQSSNRNVFVEWKEDGVYFYNKKSMTYIENLIDFHTDGVHFSRITDPTKATASDLGLGNNTTDGIPVWNNEGVIVSKRTDVSTKTYFINSTGTTDSKGTVVLTTGANTGPNRFYAPEAGGTAGQILLSSGDNVAPVWTNWIKSVKITSDAYDALVQAGQTDPSTLYLIDDSNA